MPRKENEGFSVEIEFDADKKGYEKGREIIEKKMKRDSDGSGMGFGIADVSFTFYNEKVANKRANSLKRFKWITKIAVINLNEE